VKDSVSFDGLYLQLILTDFPRWTVWTDVPLNSECPVITEKDENLV